MQQVCDADAVMSLYRNGETVAGIALSLACSTRQVSDVICRHGMSRQPMQAPVRVNAREARELDRRDGWRPREGAPHPRGRTDTYDRDRVVVVADGDMYTLIHELWIYAGDCWTLHARNRVVERLSEPEMIDVRGSLLALACEREEARRHSGLRIRTPLRQHDADDVDAQRHRAALLAARNA